MKRSIAIAVCAFALGIFAPQLLQAAERTPFQVVDGDGWLTSNATHEANAWVPIDPMRPAFGLQLSERNDLPFDKGTAGATFWVRNANCGYQFGGFGSPCGWQLGAAVTQFRSLVVGGDGIEIDGLDAGRPYGRVVNYGNGGARLTGLLTNAFVDFSGVDSPDKPSWFAGFDLASDTFAVRRAPAGSTAFADAMHVDAAGNATIAGDVAPRRATQHAANQWAARVHLAAGRSVFTFAAPFAQTPVCVATSEGAARVRVVPSATNCTIVSDDASDTAIVDVIAIGNPN